MMTVYIDDIFEYPLSGYIHVVCSTDTDVFDLLLDVFYMRIDLNGEFEDELQHDIQREYNKLLDEKGKVDIDELKERVQKYDYQMI